jgi:hypothetical protein
MQSMRCYWNYPTSVSATMICALVDCGPMRRAQQRTSKILGLLNAGTIKVRSPYWKELQTTSTLAAKIFWCIWMQ